MSFGLCLLIALVGVQETLVERVVAVVGDQVITLTEVEEAARVIWIAQGGNSKSVDSVPASVRDTVLDYPIDQAALVNSFYAMGMNHQRRHNVMVTCVHFSISSSHATPLKRLCDDFKSIK